MGYNDVNVILGPYTINKFKVDQWMITQLVPNRYII